MCHLVATLLVQGIVLEVGEGISWGDGRETNSGAGETDSSASKVPAIQAWGPEFKSPEPTFNKKGCFVFVNCVLNRGTSVSLRDPVKDRKQRRYTRHQPPASMYVHVPVHTYTPLCLHYFVGQRNTIQWLHTQIINIAFFFFSLIVPLWTFGSFWYFNPCPVQRPLCEDLPNDLWVHL